jgi:threonine/homoserine/homoserine lactone efflux protein
MVMMFVASITPGPNNLMLMLAGTRFGFARTMPHLLGVTAGTVLVICMTYAGLGTVILRHHLAVDCLTVMRALYLMLSGPLPMVIRRISPARCSCTKR